MLHTFRALWKGSFNGFKHFKPLDNGYFGLDGFDKLKRLDICSILNYFDGKKIACRHNFISSFKLVRFTYSYPNTTIDDVSEDCVILAERPLLRPR